MYLCVYGFSFSFGLKIWGLGECRKYAFRVRKGLLCCTVDGFLKECVVRSISVFMLWVCIVDLN